VSDATDPVAAPTSTRPLRRQQRLLLGIGMTLSVVLSAGYGALAGQEPSVDALVSALYGLVIGALVGPYLLFASVKLRRWPVWLLVLAHTVVLTAILVLVLSSGRLLRGAPGHPPLRLDTLLAYLGSVEILQHIAFGMFVSLAVSFTWSMVALLGPETLGLLLLGRYRRPRREHRVFLFLDLSGSTRLAEQLGDRRFHALIHDFFDDIADPILDHHGHTHRYLGDEALVSWPVLSGGGPVPCLQAVAAVRAALDARAQHYLKAYGETLDFRAGLHSGPVLAAEVGKYKQEIVFLGDSVNTAARVAALCRDEGCAFLLTREVLQVATVPAGWQARPLGQRRLRGRVHPVELYALEALGGRDDLASAGLAAAAVAPYPG